MTSITIGALQAEAHIQFHGPGNGKPTANKIDCGPVDPRMMAAASEGVAATVIGGGGTPIYGHVSTVDHGRHIITVAF